ncbi:MAG: hypothetical protein FWG90_12010 [Oscillospiraceae bacterium]|nr:hypothetical protein [Oscillospiraceae bacterium]
MKERFFKFWFEGFERSLQNIDDESRKDILKECGKSCSDSYTKQIYLDEYNASQSFDDFLSRLKKRFPEIGFKVIKSNEIIELTYNYCACDLVKSKYVETPLLCECSRQSLLYNWGSAFGRDKVTVQLQQSILGGSSSCKFLINLLSEHLQ